MLSLICRGELDWQPEIKDCLEQTTLAELVQMEREGLLSIQRGKLTVTEAGKAFIRNICLVFDLRQRQQTASRQQAFSKAI